jgi:hypothetical protein
MTIVFKRLPAASPRQLWIYDEKNYSFKKKAASTTGRQTTFTMHLWNNLLKKEGGG